MGEDGSSRGRAAGQGGRRVLGGGRFEVLSVLGEGSIGVVYRARHTGLGSVVAVKVLHEAFRKDAEFCRRFHAEALAMSQLDHPNLLHIYDFGQDPDGSLFISMPFVDGVTLRALLDKSRTLEVPRIVSLMMQVCAGLGHAHARGLVHRDVKPDNVMIVTKDDDDGNRVETVKILDFGFAVPASVTGEVAQRLAGTPVYMSPEQCRGESLDARSDVYACGIMLFELATGTVPFLSTDLKALRDMHLSAQPPLVASKRPDIDPRFDRIVQKALAKSREDRHANMVDLRAELKSLTSAPAQLQTSTWPEPITATSIHPPPVVRPSMLPSLTPPSLARPPTSSSFVPNPPPSNVSIIPPSGSSPSLTPPPPPSTGRASRGPDWLEDNASSYSHLLDGTMVNEATANLLATNASVWFGELTRERDPRGFVRRMDELETAVRVLAHRGDAKTLRRVSVVVSGLEAPHFENALAALKKVQRLFSDPQVLRSIAIRVLTSEDADAAELLTRARVPGAVALYGARAKLASSSGLSRARIVFVTTMRGFGVTSLPVVKAALERVFDQAIGGQNRVAVELAEDVLLSVPRIDDEPTAAMVVKYAGSVVPTLSRAAARALPRVLAKRAAPVLVQLMQSTDDSVCIAAVAGLHELEAVDADVVARIGALVDAGRARTPQVRGAFVTALQGSIAKGDARAVLARLG